METEYVGLPGALVEKAKEAAAREEITVEELVCDAVEQRINGKGFRDLYSIAKRNAERTGITPENAEAVVMAEIAAHRSERSR